MAKSCKKVEFLLGDDDVAAENIIEIVTCIYRNIANGAFLKLLCSNDRLAAIACEKPRS